MSMTREEAIKQLKGLYSYCQNMKIENDDFPVWEDDCKALKLAIAALTPINREQVEKVWRGEWFDYRETSVGVPKRLCSRCGRGFIGFDTKFCENCGAPMTDEAVQMVMERLEVLKDGSTTD